MLLTSGVAKIPLRTLEEVERAYGRIRGRIGVGSTTASTSKSTKTDEEQKAEKEEREQNFTFFEIYYGGFELLREVEDFYDLAIEYFEKAGKMNIRYCEAFFDAQGHLRRGVGMDVIMSGFGRAKRFAEENFGVS